MRALPVLALVAGCYGARPNTDELTTNVEVTSTDDPAVVTAVFVDRIDAADVTVDVILPAGDDTALSDALIAASDRGVAVRVVLDTDLGASPVATALTDAGLDLVLADGALTYFDFDSSADVAWPSEQVTCAHAFVVVDRTYWAAASTVGGSGDGSRIVLSGHSEDLGEDLSSEFVQMHGGTDATSLDAYAASGKSIVDARWHYGTQTDADLELWLNPQERVGKKFIDSVYSSRHTIRIASDDITSDGLIHALSEKADSGFQIQVLVGPHFGDNESAISGDLLDIGGIEVRQVQDAVLPTIGLFDIEDDSDSMRRVLIATHPLYSPPKFYRGQPTMTDQLIDGEVWILTSREADSPLLQPVITTFQAAWDRGVAL